MTRYVKVLDQLGLAGSYSEKLSGFAELFARWNAKINLSAARTLEQLDEHVIDSLHIVRHIEGSSVLDVGSGGGFPVVISAICLPATRFTSLEPTHKKHSFLKTAARELGLSNLVPLAVRLEDHAAFNYDLAMSRATFELTEWLHRGLSYVRDGGAVLGFEAQRRDDLPATVERHPYELDGKHRAIVIQRK